MAGTALPQIVSTPKHCLEPSECEDGVSTFVFMRPRLLGIARRILGDTCEAEDLVQDVWLRWQRADRAEVENPSAFLATTISRLCINVVQSARVRRRTDIAAWLSEPANASEGPEAEIERREALSVAFLLLFERLSPKQRAAYILREAFDYPYGEIANVLRVQEASARQLVSRARRQITDGHRMAVNSAKQRRLVATFLTAANDGDLSALESLFAEEIVDPGKVMEPCNQASRPGPDVTFSFGSLLSTPELSISAPLA